MNSRMFSFGVPVVLLAISPPSHAYDVTDHLAIGGVLAGAGQCSILSDTDVDNKCMAGLPFQPELDFNLTETDEIFFKFGFAVGNGLNENSPFVLSPWAADLEDDVKDINGRNRDYLLTAWYKHTFVVSEDNTVGVSLGILDATDYLDDNAYSNDEYTQFMNEALVNGPHVFVPSYDGGAALEWDNGPFSARVVGMNIGENDDGQSYNFGGVQLGYTAQTSMGEGTYRVLVTGTSEDFTNPSGTSDESLAALSFSFDQQLGDIFGAWLRFGWQSDDAAVDYDAIYSGGVNINGGGWGRADDNIGIGYAYLNGGNLDIDKSQVAEAYYRFVLNEFFALTADLQYMKDDHKGSGTDSPKGWILGLRAAAEF